MGSNEMACRERPLKRLEPVCRTIHRRFVVDLAGTGKRPGGKAAKAGLA
ncbi:MAG: hypothetical protein NDJ19_02340 [Ramlibacter sp.]|nr:hypothetical protein [Ramlibacter sp.]